MPKGELEEFLEMLAHRREFELDIYRILEKMPRDREIFLKVPYWMRLLTGLANLNTEDTLTSLRKLNWAKDHVEHLRRRFQQVRTLYANEKIAVGVTPDVHFNGEYYKLSEGFVLALPSGVQTFLRFEAEMFGDGSDLAFRQKMAEGFSHATGTWNGRASRHMRYWRVGFRKQRATYDEVKNRAWGVEHTLRCYADLNTVVRPDLDHGRRPLPFGPFFVGHRLETGTHLSVFATNFLLLHELGHVEFGHDHKRVTPNCERQADNFAIATILSNQYDDSEKVANLIGAFFSLYILSRLETLDQSGETGTHPPAQSRIQDLRTLVEASNASPRVKDDFRGMTEHLSALGEFFHLYRAAEDMAHTVDQVLIGSIGTDYEGVFKEQVLRWMLVGSSDMLCDYLGKLKYRLEEKPDGLDEEKRLNALRQINDVFELTKDVIPIGSKLQFAYANAAQA